MTGLDIEGVLARHQHEWGDGLETVYCTGCDWSCDGYAEPVDLESGLGGWHVAFIAHVAAVLREQIVAWLADFPWTETTRDDLLAALDASSREEES